MEWRWYSRGRHGGKEVFGAHSPQPQLSGKAILVEVLTVTWNIKRGLCLGQSPCSKYDHPNWNCSSQTPGPKCFPEKRGIRSRAMHNQKKKLLCSNQVSCILKKGSQADATTTIRILAPDGVASCLRPRAELEGHHDRFSKSFLSVIHARQRAKTMSAQLWPPLQPSGGLAEGGPKSAQPAAKDGLWGLDWHQIGYPLGTSLIIFIFG